MQYSFEIYILEETITKEQWQKLYDAILLYVGRGSHFQLIFGSVDNHVRFWIECDKDLSAISNAVDGLLLRPEPTRPELPQTNKKVRFLDFVSGGNILDFKEKLAVKRSLTMHYAVFDVRAYTKSHAAVKNTFYFTDTAKQWVKTVKLHTAYPAHLFAIDFLTNTHYLKRTVPRYLNIEKSLHMLSSENLNALVSIDTFPYFSHNYYLNLTSYEFDKHSFIIGASGSGKSKYIGLFVDRLQRTALKNNYRVVVIDPHASLAEDFAYIPNQQVINFDDQSTELFAGGASDISAATELTTTLFKSLMADNYNSKIDRVLRFSLYMLFTAQNMSLNNLKRFLTESDLRQQIIDHVREYVPSNIILFFGGDFNEMRTKYYNEALAPIIAFVDEMQLQPVLVGEGELSLTNTIRDNFLTVFSLNKVRMGEKVVKTVAGLLIQQIFLLAQARAFDRKVILIIDEVSVVQNPALASILSEARKFNLSVILTQQYFGQIEKDLQAAIFSNVYNYYAFKVSEEDARALEGNMTIELPKEMIENANKQGIKEKDLRIKLMTELHPRECLIRVLANGQVVPAVKARTLDAPTSPAKSVAPESLKVYKPPKANLPAKFDEETIHQQRSKPLDTVAEDNATPAPAAQPHTPPTKPAGIFNLSELLASQSSSRIKVSKKESA